MSEITPPDGAESTGPAPQGSTGGSVRQLRRSRTDRKLAGVCGGLGAYTNLDPIIFRVLFAVFTLFGGFGLLLYGVAWLFIPDEQDDRSEAQHLFREGHTTAGALWAIAATVVGLLIFFAIAANEWDVVFWLVIGSAITFVVLRSRTPRPNQVGPWWTAPPPPPGGAATPPVETPPTVAGPSAAPGYGPAPAPPTETTGTWEPQPGWQPKPRPAEPERPREPSSPLPWLTLSAALVVGGILAALDLADLIDISAETAIAIMLIIFGVGLVVSAWYGRARSLIGLGIAALIALVVVAAVDVPLSGGFGERRIEPVSAADLGDPVRLAAGKIVIDLTKYDQPTGAAAIDASVGAGEIVVIYPDDIRIDASADVSAGNVDTVQAEDVRVNGDHVVHDPTGLSRGAVRLNLDIGAGTIRFEEASRASS
jgi:phage shock protein PspC (stress-responsive transcriptional regulator)